MKHETAADGLPADYPRPVDGDPIVHTVIALCHLKAGEAGGIGALLDADEMTEARLLAFLRTGLLGFRKIQVEISPARLDAELQRERNSGHSRTLVEVFPEGAD